jgi:hypothetical protein
MKNLKLAVFYAILFYVCLPGIVIDAGQILQDQFDIKVDTNIAHAVIFALLFHLTHKWAMENLTEAVNKTN